MSVPGWLLALGIPENCITGNSSAEENKRRFSIRPQAGDEIWCVKVDNGWITDNTHRKVDYLFWGQSKSGRRVVLLVELKGSNFRQAIRQIESTLQQLCKNSEDGGIHTGNHRNSPGHGTHSQGGVQAYVVLSKGPGVAQSQTEIRRIQKSHGVRVILRGQRFEANGLDALFD